jgi:hypothetical protein
VVHKKYTYKDGKRFGPYYYETKRVNGKIITKYLGSDIENNFFSKHKLLFVFYVSFFSLALFLVPLNITGNVSLEVHDTYNVGDVINGKFNLNLAQGELIPSDSIVTVKYGNITKDFILSSLVNEPAVQGNFYSKSVSIEGYGDGYGLIGTNKEYPFVDFDLRVVKDSKSSDNSNSENSVSSETSENTQNVEGVSADTGSSQSSDLETSSSETSSDSTSSSENLDQSAITGSVISEATISGRVSKNQDFTYSLNDGETVELVPGSIYYNGEMLNDDSVKIKIKNGEVTVSTSYSIDKEGYGEDFAGNKKETISLNLESFGLVATENSEISIVLSYGNDVISQDSKNIVIISDNSEIDSSSDSGSSGVVEDSNISPDLNGSTSNQTIPSNNTLSNSTIVSNFTVTNQTSLINDTLPLIVESSTNVTVEQFSAVIGKPVKWKKTIEVDANDTSSLVVEIPLSADNITVNKIKLNGESVSDNSVSPITGGIIANGNVPKKSFISKILDFFALTGRAIDDSDLAATSEISLEIDQTDDLVEVEYYTDAPTSTEEDEGNKKIVHVSSPSDVHYENVLIFTNLSNSLRINSLADIKIEWVENNSLLDIYYANDTNNDGYYDYIEWIAPHLSNQTFNIIVITNAQHLDQNKIFVSNIYNETKALDGIWSETIPDGHYVRVTFEHNLTFKNDITLYPRVVSGNPSIIIYEYNQTNPIAQFSYIKNETYNRVILSGLQNSQDTFDLYITGGEIQFDHIIDPAIGDGDAVSINPSWWTEHGENVLNANPITSINLSRSINNSKSFILLTRRAPFAEEVPADSGAYAEWVNATSFNIVKVSSEAGAIFDWYVIGGNYISVQNGSKNYSLTDKSFNITINSVNVSRSVAFINFASCGSTSSADVHEIFWIANVTSSTNLELRRDSSGACAGNVSYFVAEFNDGSTIQQGEISNVGTTASPSYANVNPVDLGSTWYYFSETTNDTAIGLGYVGVTVEPLNQTTFRFSRLSASGNGNVRAKWYVISTPGSKVQTGQQVFTSNSISINTVELNKSFATLWFNNTGTGTTWSNSMGTINISSTTTINLTRATTSNTQSGTWQVIELPIFSGVDDLPIGIFNLTSPINGSSTPVSAVNVTLYVNDSYYLGGNFNYSYFYVSKNSTFKNDHLAYYTNNFDVVAGNISFNYSIPPLDYDSNGMILLYHFDNNSYYGENRTNVVDFATGLFNGTVTSAEGGRQKSITGLGKAFKGNQSQVISIADNTLLASPYITGEVTIMFWFNLSTNNTIYGWPSPVSRSGVGTSVNRTYNVEFVNSSKTISFDTANGTGNIAISTTSTFSSNISWTHYAVTFNRSSGNATVYLNGYPEKSSILNSNPTYLTNVSGTLRVGSAPSATSYFPGLIDDLAIYNRTLSSTEVLDAYRLKEGAYYLRANVSGDTGAFNATPIYTFYIDSTPPNVTLNAPSNNTNVQSGNAIYFNWTAIDSIDLSLNCNLTIDSSVNRSNVASSNNTLINVNVTGFSFGSHYWNVSCLDDAGNKGISETRTFSVLDSIAPTINFTVPTPVNASTQSNSFSINVSVSDLSNTSVFVDFDKSLVGWWRMDDYSPTIVYDYLGVINGTINGNAAPNSSGRFNSSFSFDGTGDYLDLGDPDLANSPAAPLDVLDRFTIVAWIKPFTLGGDILSREDADAFGEFQYRLGINSSGNVFVVSPPAADTQLQVSANTWSQIALVANGSNSKLYKNGVNSTPFTFFPGSVIGGSTTIGQGGSQTQNYFNGSIDNVMFFNRSLSQTEIAQLYENQSDRYSLIDYSSISSGTHNFKAYAQDIYGNINSTETRTITVSTNVAPYNGTSLVINSTLGTNKTLDNLNVRTTLLDQNNNTINVTVVWYNNSVRHLSVPYNSSYSNGTTFIASLGYGNTTKGQNWSAQLILNDGFSSFSVNSSNLTILNSLPNVSLISPINNSVTFNRTSQIFSIAISDDDGDSIVSSRFNISLSGSSVCTDSSFNGANIYEPEFITTFDISTLFLGFNCLVDNNDRYIWSASASDDGVNYGSYSPKYRLSVQAYLDTIMNISSIDFGNLNYLASNDTVDNSPNPIILVNQGNSLVDISIQATDLWQSLTNPSSYYLAKADNVTTNGISENGSFKWPTSKTTYFPVPQTSNNTKIITDLNYTDTSDSAEIDINVTVPSSENPGARSSTITFTIVLGTGDTYAAGVGG